MFIESYFLVDKFTIFEFLRDVFIPSQRIIREKFISNTDIFIRTPDHQEIYDRSWRNTLYLSKIYAHGSNGQKGAPSLVDIFLAARIMQNTHYLLITGNKKDFSASIFDTIGVITKEGVDGSLRNYSILSFNLQKFNKCIENFEKLQKPS